LGASQFIERAVGGAIIHDEQAIDCAGGQHRVNHGTDRAGLVEDWQ